METPPPAGPSPLFFARQIAKVFGPQLVTPLKLFRPRNMTPFGPVSPDPRSPWSPAVLFYAFIVAGEGVGVKPTGCVCGHMGVCLGLAMGVCIVCVGVYIMPFVLGLSTHVWGCQAVMV